MIFPPRCITCGKLIGNKISIYEEKVKKRIESSKGTDLKTVQVGDILTKLGFKRYCCRMMFLGHLPLIDKIDNPYKYKIDEFQQET